MPLPPFGPPPLALLDDDDDDNDDDDDDDDDAVLFSLLNTASCARAMSRGYVSSAETNPAIIPACMLSTGVSPPFFFPLLPSSSPTTPTSRRCC